MNITRRGGRAISNSSRENALGPRFQSLLRITILIVQNWKQFLAIQTAGRRVTCVAYDNKPSVDAIRHAQCAQVLQ